MICRKDKDKLIIAIYVNIAGVSRGLPQEINEYLHDAFDNSVKILVLPICNENEPRYRIEAINPKLLNEVEYNKVKNQLEEIEKKYNELFSDDMG